MNSKYVRFLQKMGMLPGFVLIGMLFVLNACLGTESDRSSSEALPTQKTTKSVTPLPQVAAPTPIFTPTFTLIPVPEQPDCSKVERLANDTQTVQTILEEIVEDFQRINPKEYMGMSILHRVDRLGNWALIQGSVSGEGKDILLVEKKGGLFQIVERYTITAPLESFGEGAEQIVPEFFLGKASQAPEELFLCMNQDWLLGISTSRALRIGKRICIPVGWSMSRRKMGTHI